MVNVRLLKYCYIRVIHLYKPIISVIILVLSIQFFAMPREFYDPHMGIDNDIFCRYYHTYIVDKLYTLPNITPEPCFGKERPDIVTSMEAILFRDIQVRAPPIPQYIYT